MGLRRRGCSEQKTFYQGKQTFYRVYQAPDPHYPWENMHGPSLLGVLA